MCDRIKMKRKKRTQNTAERTRMCDSEEKKINYNLYIDKYIDWY